MGSGGGGINLEADRKKNSKVRPTAIPSEARFFARVERRHLGRGMPEGGRSRQEIYLQQGQRRQDRGAVDPGAAKEGRDFWKKKKKH